MIPQSGKLAPIKLSKEKLTFAANMCHREVSLGNWNSANASEYLSYYCFSTALKDAIIDNALNVKTFNEIEYELDEYASLIIEDKEKYPSKYTAAKFPSL